MMRFSPAILILQALLLAAVPSSIGAGASSFEADVLKKQLPLPDALLAPGKRQQEAMHQALLAKAMPLADWNAMLALQGIDPIQSQAAPTAIDSYNSSSTQSRRSLADQDDDFSVNYDDMYSFSGYSLKYAKCQPIQYFSENAILAGEHSPMVTQEIVILRLCPQSSCSSSATYGCHYNYAEYALTVEDYVSIMLRFSAKRRDYMCSYCNDCLGNGNGNNRQRQRRKLEEDNQDQANNNNNNNNEGQQDQANNNQAAGDDQHQEAAQEEQQQQDAGDDDDAAQDDDQSSAYAASACSTWSTYCTYYDKYCVEKDDDTILSFEGYLDYLQCSQVKYNNYAYFLKPRCDGYKNTIKMAVYYDQYCAQYAGNEVSIKDLGLGFRESLFEEFYNGSCIDCSESYYPPYDSASVMCNKIHSGSAKCTSDLMYDLFAGQEDVTTECSFIESIRFGTYDQVGQLSSVKADNWKTEVATSQKILLAIASVLSVLLVFYACYLHHSMTNLLIKSLSHRELLPPSRQSRRRSPHGRRSNKTLPVDEEDDAGWVRHGVPA